jgi:hypothetical protein
VLLAGALDSSVTITSGKTPTFDIAGLVATLS